MLKNLFKSQGVSMKSFMLIVLMSLFTSCASHHHKDCSEKCEKKESCQKPMHRNHDFVPADRLR